MSKPNGTHKKVSLLTVHKGRTDQFRISRNRCVLDAGFNPRIDMGELEVIAQQIKDRGIIRACYGHMQADGKFHITDGERRLRGLDIAIERGWVQGDQKLVPVMPDPKNQSNAERIIATLILNSGKPLTMLEQGTAFKRLIDEEKFTREMITERGYTLTHIKNCLSLIDNACAALAELVHDNRISATTAVEIIREVPDLEKQADVVAQAKAAAKEAGTDHITAKHLPILIGKEAQAARKQGRRSEMGDRRSEAEGEANVRQTSSLPSERHSARPSVPFEGEDTTPDTPETDGEGRFTSGFIDRPVKFTPHGISGKIQLVAMNGEWFAGFILKWPGKDGFIKVDPNRRTGPAYSTNLEAEIGGLLEMRTELAVKEFARGDRKLALEDIADHLDTLTKNLPAGATASAASHPTPMRPLLGVQTMADRVDLLRSLLDDIQAKDADKDRRKTLSLVIKFLDDKIERPVLARHITGVDK